jgi:hypothetical protein
MTATLRQLGLVEVAGGRISATPMALRTATREAVA